MPALLARTCLSVLVLSTFLLLSAAPASAQSQAPVTPTASTPQGEEAFLATYGRSDSTRALIRYWYHRRALNASWLTLQAIAPITLVLIASDPTPSDALRAVGFGVAAVSVVSSSVVLTNKIRFTERRLQQVLTGQRQLSAGLWQRALEHQRRP